MPKGALRENVEINGWLMRFQKNLKRTDETLYYCTDRNRNAKCPGAVAVNKVTNAVRVVQEHINHERDSLSNSVRQARQELRRRANDGPAREVIDSIRNDFGPQTSMALGNYNNKRSILHNAKMKEDPDTRAMNAGGPISPRYSETLDGARFLLKDFMSATGRIVIFGSDHNLNLLASGNVIFVDGTFSCVPTGFLQLFSFHVYIHNNADVVRPVAYALQENKQLLTYEYILDEMKSAPELFNWNPEMIVSDFEINIKTAFENKFPNAILHGCLFHLTQSWKRQAEKLKCYDEFITGDLQRFWQLLKILPFIDGMEISQYFQLILGETLPPVISVAANEFLNYVERNYTDGTATTAPRFPPSLWSCSLQTANGIHRTTNTVECWHRLLKSVTTKHNGLARLVLSDLLAKLKIEERHTSQDALELSINPNFKVNRNRKVHNILKDKRLREAVENVAVPPNQPLQGIQLLDSILVAKKY